MTTNANTISTLVSRQLPDFVRADHPKFQRFVELYYTWLEDETKGNTVYHIMNSAKYRDIDETPDPFIRYFKNELLPYFPETSSLDLPKILKGAREFYVKKGSVESVKWLFRVLFGEEIEIYYPKEQILIASDGKWKLPQAFKLTLSDANQNIDVNLLEKHRGTGSISKATCVIESANRTIDPSLSREVLEMYVSNVVKTFTNGENIEIPYIDGNGVAQVFVEKIIGSLSGIKVDSNIITDPQQRRRGLTYNVGDPVIVFGGLDNTVEANDAVAIVGNVTVGSIEGLAINFPGYGYRVYTNTEVVAYRTEFDDPNANASVDIRAIGIDQNVSALNSQIQFGESISVDLMAIEYAADIALDDVDWTLFSTNNRNVLLSIDNDGTEWNNNELWYYTGDGSGSYETSNMNGRFFTANTGWTGANANVILYSVQNADTSLISSLVGTDTIATVNTSATFNVSSVIFEQLAANLDSAIDQTMVYETIQTGGMALYEIINGGYGWRSSPEITTESYFDTFWSGAWDYGTANNRLLRQELGSFGQIAHVWIGSGGTGYADGDEILIGDRGYGFAGYVNVNGTGTIISTTITNRGEGYFGTKTATINTAGGSAATLIPYGFGEGVDVSVETGAIGRVRDVRMISRGYDYISSPVVSFKVVDMVIDGILDSESLSEGTQVYQGATAETADFTGIVKGYNRSTKTLRLFNYSGRTAFNPSIEIKSNTAPVVTFNVNTAATVAAPSNYPIAVIAAGLPNPWFYGNGKAKGVAEFYNGLIRYNGFYLNTDGFLSADKKLQDDRVYHNYSYIIESEKNLVDFENVMKDVVHPVGMSFLSRTITRSYVSGGIIPHSVVNTIGPVTPGSLVNISDSFDYFIDGVSTDFANTASVGDMIHIIDVTYPLRSQIKEITAVYTTAGDGFEGLDVEGGQFGEAFTYQGQGRVNVLTANTLQVSGNANSVGEFIAAGDEILIQVGTPTEMSNSIIMLDVVAGNVLTLNTPLTSGEQANISNAVYIVVPDYYTLDYPYEIITVTE